MSPEEIATIAEEAYIFSFPMLMGYRYGFATFFAPPLPSYRGPVNEMHGEGVTLDYRFRDVVTPNADTPYSMAALDLRAEPMVLNVPAVTDRYYVMQFVDLFGANSHFVGSRATGPAAGSYLLVGPGYTGDVPTGFTDVLHFDTDLVFIIGRTQLLGPDDVEALRPVMAAYRLEPLSERLGTETPTAPGSDWPVWDDEASRDERFVGYVNALLELCQPPHPDEIAMPSVMAPTAVAQRSPHSFPPSLRRSTGGWRWRRSALASSSPATICCGRLGRWPAGAVTTSSRRFTRLPARTLTVNHSQVTGPTGCDSTHHLPRGRFSPSRCTTPRTTVSLDTSSRTRSSGT